MNIDSLRREYLSGNLNSKDLETNPVIFFKQWLDFAIENDFADPNAMILSTVGHDGFPQSRIVLLKSIEENNFSFFTNYNSKKGESIELNNKVSLNFYWPENQRQVRITGTAKKISQDKSDQYFSSRPKNSQLSVWVSDQSSEINSRDFLEKRYAFFKNKFKSKKIPRPDHWGGYEVNPLNIEFWQGRENRLHDRFLYTKDENSWIIKRLAP